MSLVSLGSERISFLKIVFVFWSFWTYLFAVAFKVKFMVNKFDIADIFQWYFSVDHNFFNWWYILSPVLRDLMSSVNILLNGYLQFNFFHVNILSQVLTQVPSFCLHSEEHGSTHMFTKTNLSNKSSLFMILLNVSQLHKSFTS